LGLVVGKPVGVFLMSWLAVRAGFAELPKGVNWNHILGAGMLAGIGFTMSLFVANLAFRVAGVETEAKLAILAASLTSGVLGYVWLRFVASRSTRPAPTA
jgi:NhaA family Na+:H+ antiporter